MRPVSRAAKVACASPDACPRLFGSGIGQGLGETIGSSANQRSESRRSRLNAALDRRKDGAPKINHTAYQNDPASSARALTARCGVRVALASGARFARSGSAADDRPQNEIHPAGHATVFVPERKCQKVTQLQHLYSKLSRRGSLCRIDNCRPKGSAAGGWGHHDTTKYRAPSAYDRGCSWRNCPGLCSVPLLG